MEKVKANIHSMIKLFPYSSQSTLYEDVTVLKTGHRDLLVKSDIPDRCGGKAIALEVRLLFCNLLF